MTQSKTNMPVETAQMFQIEICEVIKKKEVEIIFQLKYETLSQSFPEKFSRTVSVISSWVYSKFGICKLLPQIPPSKLHRDS